MRCSPTILLLNGRADFLKYRFLPPTACLIESMCWTGEVSKIAVTPDNAILYGVGLEHDEKITLYIFRLS